MQPLPAILLQLACAYELFFRRKYAIVNLYYIAVPSQYV